MSHRLLSRALVSVALFPATILHAQSVTDLGKVVEQTLLTNPEIQTRYHDFRASMEGQNVARGGFLPEVNATGSYGREFRNNVPETGSEAWNRPGYNVELRQMLFDGFRTSNNVKQLGFEKLARYYDLIATSDDTAFAAVQAYIDTQRYRELEVLARQNYTLHGETLKQIRERSDSGVGRRVDYEQAGGRLALAQTNLMTETANLLDVTQRYRRLTGTTPAQTLVNTPDVDNRLPPHPKDFLDSLRRNPTILSKQASLRAANAGQQVAKGGYSPRFDFVAATGNDQSQSDPSYRDVRSSSVQVTMSMNLYRGGADAARIRQTSAQTYAARDLRDYTCRNVQQDLAIAWNNISRQRQQLPFLREHELATTKVRDAYRQQFQIGQRSLLDLLDTENELFESRRALTNGVYDLKVAEFRFLALSHRLLVTLGLTPARDEVPEEEKNLEASDETLKLCSSDVPDVDRLTPVSVEYHSGDLPPTLTALDPAPRPATSAPIAR